MPSSSRCVISLGLVLVHSGRVNPVTPRLFLKSSETFFFPPNFVDMLNLHLTEKPEEEEEEEQEVDVCLW